MRRARPLTGFKINARQASVCAHLAAQDDLSAGFALFAFTFALPMIGHGRHSAIPQTWQVRKRLRRPEACLPRAPRVRGRSWMNRTGDNPVNYKIIRRWTDGNGTR